MNFLPIFVVTFWLNGGLNHVMLRVLLFLLSDVVGDVGCSGVGVEVVFVVAVVIGVDVFVFLSVYSNSYLYPHFRSASLYGGVASLNISALEEFVDRRLLILCGILLMMDGGWLLRL